MAISAARRAYMREYQKRWLAKRRADWFAENGPCVQCGSLDRLEIDHVDPATKDPKLKPGTGIWSWTKARRDVELAKCQVLCRRCHAEKSATDEGGPPLATHGTSSRYRKGCSCVACRAAHARQRGIEIARQRAR